MAGERGRGAPSKYTDAQIREVRRLYLAGTSKTRIAELTGISARHVLTVVTGKTRLNAIALPPELAPLGDDHFTCVMWRTMEALRLALTPAQRAKFDAL